jgi:hypothetical protein
MAVVITLIFYSCWFPTLAQETYPYISAQRKGPANPLSPDPIIEYKWKDPKATDGLEIYYLDAVSYKASTPASFNMTRFFKEKKYLFTVPVLYDLILAGQAQDGWNSSPTTLLTASP